LGVSKIVKKIVLKLEVGVVTAFEGDPGAQLGPLLEF
jgi:hypothetical protein